jgi:hypothetical protein
MPVTRQIRRMLRMAADHRHPLMKLHKHQMAVQAA